jgi:hypothetical protein
MNSLPLVVLQGRATAILRGSKSRVEQEPFLSHAFEAWLACRQRRRSRSGASRSLDTGHGAIALKVFAPPVPRTWIRLHSLDPPR